MPRLSGPSVVHAALGVCLAAAVLGGISVVAQTKQDFSVTAYKYGYRISGSDRAEMHVHEGDLVRVRFAAEDVPHSFTIDDDHYRISRRAEPGKPVMFDFRADKVGTFEIYCNLSDDPRCRRETRGKLVVDPK